MPKIKYVNKASGKTYTGDAEDIKILQSNKLMADRFSFETEAEKPKEVNSNKSESKVSDK